MSTKQSHFDRVPQSTQTGQLIPTNTELYNPASWIQTGYTPSDIILSTAILVSAVASLIAALKSSSRPR
jgi:hypothetical protein